MSPRADDERPLVEHLEEFRRRVIRACLYVLVGAAVAWAGYDWLIRIFFEPAWQALRDAGGQVVALDFTEAFGAQIKVSFLAGFILAAPLVLWELWAFIRPGLTPRERAAVRYWPPVMLLLFAGGLAFAWALMPRVVAFFIQFTPPGVTVYQSLGRYIGLAVKVYLAFGLVFQFPILLLILGRIGLIGSGALLRQWRQAIVVIMILAAIITPTWDPVTLLAATLPIVLLYFGTIGVMRIFEGRRTAEDALREETERDASE